MKKIFPVVLIIGIIIIGIVSISLGSVHVPLEYIFSPEKAPEYIKLLFLI